MEPRILRVGEKVTGRYSGMELGKSRKFFWVKLGEEEFYLPSFICQRTWGTPFSRAIRWAISCLPFKGSWMSMRLSRSLVSWIRGD